MVRPFRGQAKGEIEEGVKIRHRAQEGATPLVALAIGQLIVEIVDRRLPIEASHEVPPPV